MCSGHLNIVFLSPAVFFLEFWKRKEITLAYQWDCLGYESEEERPRPTFAALAPEMRDNPVTRISEPHFPDERRKPRLFSGIFIIITMVCIKTLFRYSNRHSLRPYLLILEVSHFHNVSCGFYRIRQYSSNS